MRDLREKFFIYKNAKKRQIRKLIYLQNIEIFKNMKLHYSQANNATISRMIKFYYHMKLHYYQTMLVRSMSPKRALLPYEITLLSNWRYSFFECSFRFITIWNYTTLKRAYGLANIYKGFITIWNYTTLKPQFLSHAYTRMLYFHMELDVNISI